MAGCRRFVAVASFGVVEREGQQDDAAAALLCAAPRGVVGEEVLERGQQEGAEAALVLSEVREVAALEQRGQEALRQIARVVRRCAPPADVRVERIPVGFAERGQRGARRRRVVAASRDHETPARGLKRQGRASYARPLPVVKPGVAAFGAANLRLKKRRGTRRFDSRTAPDRPSKTSETCVGGRSRVPPGLLSLV